jgi:hypothetical protein
VPHDIHRVVGFEDLILAEGVQARDEYVRYPRFFVGLLYRWHHFVVNLHNYTILGVCEP